MITARVLLLPATKLMARRRDRRPLIRGIFAVAALLAGLTVSPGPIFAAEPIATADGEQPGTRIELTELKRTGGGAVMLKFNMINEGNSAIDLNGYGSQSPFAEKSADDARRSLDDASISGVSLVDDTHKKKYLVVRDSEGSPLCSRGVGKIKSGSQSALWARFPAPPDNVDKVSVVVPHFTPMDDVPLGR